MQAFNCARRPSPGIERANMKDPPHGPAGRFYSAFDRSRNEITQRPGLRARQYRLRITLISSSEEDGVHGLGEEVIFPAVEKFRDVGLHQILEVAPQALDEDVVGSKSIPVVRFQ